MSSKAESIKDCACGRPAYTERMGRRLQKWWVACGCGQRTEYHVSYKRAIAAWNEGERRPRQEQPTP